MQQVLLTCRPGFESDLAAEIQEKADACGVFGFVRAKADQGFVIFEGHESDAGKTLVRKLAFADLVFARQWLLVNHHLDSIPVDDRVGPITESLSALPMCALWMTFPDTNEGKSLSRLTRKLERPLSKAVTPLLQSTAPWYGHVFFLSGSEAWVGYTPVNNASQSTGNHHRLPCMG